MSAEAELKILNLCKGLTIKQAGLRLDIARQYVANKTLKRRVQLSGLRTGD